MRPYTKGFVRRDFKSNTWYAVLTWMEDGKQRRISKSTKVRCYPDKQGAKTRDNRGKAKAEQFLARWRSELVAEEARTEAETAIPSVGTPLHLYARSYVEAKERSGKVAHTTIVGYRSHLRHLEGTELGETPVCKVTPKAVEEWEAMLAENGLAPTTRSHIHVFVKQVFGWGVRRGELARNPLDLVAAPKHPRKPVNSLNADGVKTMYESLEGEGASGFATAAKLAVATGMRQGEICGLRWIDVDMQGRVIHIHHSLAREKGGHKLGAPKTATSVRSIPFGDGVAATLEARLEKMQGKCSVCGEWDDALYVCGNPISGTPLNPQVLGREWRTFARIARLVGSQGEPPRFHDLRHTFATLAIAGKVDPKTVSSLLGHASIQMTMDVYADALGETKRTAMNELDSVLSPETSPETK